MEQLITTIFQKRTAKPARSLKQVAAIETTIKASLLLTSLVLWIAISISSDAVATYQSIAAGSIVSLLGLLHILGQSSHH